MIPTCDPLLWFRWYQPSRTVSWDSWKELVSSHRRTMYQRRNWMRIRRKLIMLRGSYDEDKSSGSVASAESRLRCEAQRQSSHFKDTCMLLYLIWIKHSCLVCMDTDFNFILGKALFLFYFVKFCLRVFLLRKLDETRNSLTRLKSIIRQQIWVMYLVGLIKKKEKNPTFSSGLPGLQPPQEFDCRQ